MSSATRGIKWSSSRSENTTSDMTRIIRRQASFSSLCRSSHVSLHSLCFSNRSHDSSRERAEYILASITRIWRDAFVRASCDGPRRVSAHVRSLLVNEIHSKYSPNHPETFETSTPTNPRHKLPEPNLRVFHRDYI